MTHETTGRECTRCAGCGRIADDDDGTPWKYRMQLPAESLAAVWLGLVKPLTCPDCNGTGRVRTEAT